MRGALLVALLVLAPAAASAQRVALDAEAQPCAPGVDAAALRERVALELGPTVEVVERGDGADYLVHVREGCPAIVIELELEARDLLVRRSVDLGSEPGAARRWALALLIVDMLRAPPREPAVAEPEPAVVAPPAPPATPPGAESPAPPPAPADRASQLRTPEAAAPGVDADAPGSPLTVVSVEATVRTYLLVSTPLVGVALGISHAWLRVALAGAGTELAARDGRAALGAFQLQITVTPLEHREPDWSLAAELMVGGGVGHGAGRSDGARGLGVWFPMLGAGAGARLRWRASRQLLVDVSLTAGFNPLGTNLDVSGEQTATTWGPWVQLTAGGSIPL